jgi:endonuclease YncB( thermonuclease family)
MPPVLLGALFLFALSPSPASARQYQQVTVLEISEGDTLSVRAGDNSILRVRISAIDAPDGKQEYGQEATRALSKLLQDQRPDLDCSRIDRYRRNICRIFVGGKDVGLTMIELGAAWWFEMLSAEQKPEERVRYESAQKAAKEARRGLWSGTAVAPWDWRAQQTRKPFDSLINPY